MGQCGARPADRRFGSSASPPGLRAGSSHPGRAETRVQFQKTPRSCPCQALPWRALWVCPRVPDRKGGAIPGPHRLAWGLRAYANSSDVVWAEAEAHISEAWTLSAGQGPPYRPPAPILSWAAAAAWL